MTVMLLLGVGGYFFFTRRQQRGRNSPTAPGALNQCPLKLRSECGISINPSLTLDAVVSELSRKPVLDLQSILRQHLHARFGNGPPQGLAN